MKTSVLVFPSDVWASITACLSASGLVKLLLIGSPALSSKVRPVARLFEVSRLHGFLDLGALFRSMKAFPGIEKLTVIPFTENQLVLSPTPWEIAPSALTYLRLEFAGCVPCFFSPTHNPAMTLPNLIFLHVLDGGIPSSSDKKTTICLANFPPLLEDLCIASYRSYKLQDLDGLPRSLTRCLLGIMGFGLPPSVAFPRGLLEVTLNLKETEFSLQVLPPNITDLQVGVEQPRDLVLPKIGEWRSLFPHLRRLNVDFNTRLTASNIDLLPLGLESINAKFAISGAPDDVLHEILSRRGAVLKGLARQQQVPSAFVKHFKRLESLSLIEEIEEFPPSLTSLEVESLITTKAIPQKVDYLYVRNLHLGSTEGVLGPEATRETVLEFGVPLPTSITRLVLGAASLHAHQVLLLPPLLKSLVINLTGQKAAQDLNRLTRLSSLTLYISGPMDLDNLPITVEEVSIYINRLTAETGGLRGCIGESDDEAAPIYNAYVNSLEKCLPRMLQLKTFAFAALTSGLPVKVLHILPPNLERLNTVLQTPATRKDLLALPRSLVMLDMRWTYQWPKESEVKKAIASHNPNFSSSVELPLPPNLMVLRLPHGASEISSEELVKRLPKKISTFGNAAARFLELYYASKPSFQVTSKPLY